jgi:hypothetical protein
MWRPGGTDTFFIDKIKEVEERKNNEKNRHVGAGSALSCQFCKSYLKLNYITNYITNN